MKNNSNSRKIVLRGDGFFSVSKKEVIKILEKRLCNLNYEVKEINEVYPQLEKKLGIIKTFRVIKKENGDILAHISEKKDGTFNVLFW